MKYFIKILFFSILFISPLFSFSEVKEIILVTDNYPPFISDTKNEENIFLNIVQDVFKDTKYNVIIKYYPWPRCEYMVKQGLAFAAFPYTKTEERLKYFIFSDAVMTDETIKVISVKKLSGKKIITFNDLKSVKIGAVSGFFYSNFIDQNSIICDYSYNENDLMTKFFNGRFDVVIANLFSIKKAFNELAEKNKKEIYIYDINELKVFYHLMASKKYSNSEIILNEFNIKLKNYKKTAKYNNQISSYQKLLISLK